MQTYPPTGLILREQ